MRFELCIDPQNPFSHPSDIVDIVSGKVGDDAVNAQVAVWIGQEAMKEHQ